MNTMTIEEIQKYYSEYCTDDCWKEIPIKLPAGVLRVIFAELDRLQSAERWHKYPDEKPEEKEKIYLVYFSRTGDIMRAMWDYQGCQQFCEVDDGEYYGKEMQGITHWRPLPQPPSESQVTE